MFLARLVAALSSLGFLVAAFLSSTPAAAWEPLSTGPSKEKANLTAGSAIVVKDDLKASREPLRASVSAEQSGGDRVTLLKQATDEGQLFSKSTNLSTEIGIPLVFNEAVDRYINYFSITKRDLFKRWLKRKSLYEPLIKEILKEHGLPEDLVYLAMIESGFNLQAYSPMKAAGPWQFIPETGRRYGLTVNHWVDERRDIEKSTVAAARYLDELFNQFDCWYLAAAAYNTGENRIDRLIKRHDTKDFWELRSYNTLPHETREYVPQLIAAAIIAKNPEKYGLGDYESVAPLEFVGEEVPGGVPLTAVAEAASTDLHSVIALNPQLRRGITPPGEECRIKLPPGTDSDTFQNSLTSILEKGKRVMGVVRHMIGKRDNVAKITQRYGISKEDLVLVNGKRLKWKKGELVYIPQFGEVDGDEEPASGKTAELRREPTEKITKDGSGHRKSKIGRSKGIKVARVHKKVGSTVASHLKKAPRNPPKKQPRPSERRKAFRHR